MWKNISITILLITSLLIIITFIATATAAAFFLLDFSSFFIWRDFRMSNRFSPLYFSFRFRRWFHNRIFFLKILVPNCHKLSDINPTGQIQAQKLFFRKRPNIKIIIKMTSPDGWISLITPVNIQYFKLISALIGKNPSTPGGREKYGVSHSD